MALEPDDVTLGRLRRFLDERLTPALDAEHLPLIAGAWELPGEPVPAAEALAVAGEHLVPVAPGQPWGRPWSTTWLRLSGEVPAAWAEHETQIDVLVDLGFTRDTPGFQAEGTARDRAGGVLKGIAPRNRHVPLPLVLGRERELAGGQDGDAVTRWRAGCSPLPLELWVEAAANPVLDPGFTFAPTPLGDPATLPDEPSYRWGEFVLRRRHEDAWGLWRDLRVLREQIEALPVDSLRRGRVLRAIAHALDLAGIASPGEVRAGAARARGALADVLAEGGEERAHRVVAVGHAHIDSAWLWPFRETRRKVVRTYSNALALLREYPETTFVTSSAQHLAWVKEAEPALFERLREAVAEGRFVPVGGMWVEADTMMPVGESMVRQFLEGATWMAEELGVRCEEVWLPDSFGYSAALPQIVRGVGARWFLTQKLSWNDTNRMPHHTFTWEGIDGSRVLVHFPPVDNYNCDLAPRQLAHAARNVADSDAVSARLSLAPSGWGDGGGGPTREHAETARRTAHLAGSPEVSWGTPAAFFSEVEEMAEREAAAGAALPVWTGEMPLELHRGIFTSQQRTKAGNRRCEALLHEAELWCATATVRTGMPYPLTDLRDLWRTVLLYQFHDVLPGTSIAWVHQEVEREHARVARRCEELIAGALAALAGTESDVREPGSEPAGGDRGEGDRPGGQWSLNPAPVAVGGIAPFGAGRVEPARPAVPERRAEGWVLQDDLVRVVVDADGHVRSLVERASGRDAVGPAGPGNVVRLHRDLPNRWDAWDVDAHQRRVSRNVPEARVRAEDGGLVVERTIGSSSLVQRLAVEHGALRVRTEVDWREREEMLSLLWGLDLRCDDVAAQTQFGHVRRPVHRSTSWQSARFVDVTHRWVHLGEPGFGVGVANHTTHGYDVERETREDGGTTTRLRLHLLRGARYPDPGADLGHHSFVHLLRPGATLDEAVADGYALAFPPRPLGGADLRMLEPLVRVTGEGVIAETVKLAHDGSGDVIVRLYESRGARSRALVRPVLEPRSTARVWRTDLMERPIDGSTDGCVAFEQRDGEAEVTLRPFGIVTLRARETGR